MICGQNAMIRNTSYALSTDRDSQIINQTALNLSQILEKQMQKPFPSLRSIVSVFSLCLWALALQAQAAGNDKSQGKFIGAKQTEYPDWFKESFLDFKEDVAEAAANGKRLMVLFTQDGCPYCNILVERNLSQKDIEQTIRKNFDVVALNMWGDREVASLGGKRYTEKTFAAALKVQFTPTILFFNEQGKVVLRLNGYLPPARFKHAVDYVANKMEKRISYRDYQNKFQAGHSSAKMLSEDFFEKPPFDLSKQKSKPIALFFEQPDCPNCVALHEKVLSNQGVRATLKDFVVVQLNMWSDQPLTLRDGSQTTARKLAETLDVKYAPTIVVLNPQGAEVIRSEAFFKVFHTNGILTYVSSEQYRKQPSFQRYLADKAHDIQASGKDVNIWSMEGEAAKK